MVFKKLFNRDTKEPEKLAGKPGEFGKEPGKFGGEPGQKSIEEINAEKAAYMAKYPPSAPPPMGAKKYVAGPADTLSGIAQKFYGDGSGAYWKLILDANPEMLKGNSGNIKDGMELYIPELPPNMKK